MVYPEKLILDQVADKSTSRTSWCNEPLEYTSNFVNVNRNTAKKNENEVKNKQSDESIDKKIDTASSEK